jgi:hypothetical protein
MSDFKGRHFEGAIVLWAVRWYCRYGVSYRDLEQMLGERGVAVDHLTIYRWVQHYAPEIEKRLRWQWRAPLSTSWRVDETYVKVRGKWAYLAARRSGPEPYCLTQRCSRASSWLPHLNVPQVFASVQTNIIRRLPEWRAA